MAKIIQMVMALTILTAGTVPSAAENKPPPGIGACMALDAVPIFVEIFQQGERPLRNRTHITVRMLRECADVIEKHSVEPEPEPTCGTLFTPPCDEEEGEADDKAQR